MLIVGEGWHVQNVLLLVSILGCGYFAAKEKAFWNMRRSIEATPSPLSKAIGQLLGIAGGIYLALSLLASFISLELPQKIDAFGLFMDPLALAAMFLAIVQPYTIRLYYFVRKRKK